jgi:hypothetical protein
MMPIDARGQIVRARARCCDGSGACGEPATNQALYRRRDDGTHFLGQPVCDGHRYTLGVPTNAKLVEIVDHVEVAR